MKVRSRVLFGAVALGLAVSACGSSDVSEDASEPAATESATTVADTDDATAPAEAAPPETAPPETEAPAGAVLNVSGGTADPWEIAGSCQWTPENTGGASSLWVVEDTDDSGEGDIGIFESWPIQVEEGDEPVVIGSIVEPGGQLLSVIDAEASADGGVLTVMAGVVLGVDFKEEPDLTVTVTCEL